MNDLSMLIIINTV